MNIIGKLFQRKKPPSAKNSFELKRASDDEGKDHYYFSRSEPDGTNELITPEGYYASSPVQGKEIKPPPPDQINALGGELKG
ncbi:hypothetical protein A2773_05620 [Candidatus Gottesmanbacteria bacterium RIFCSPHIGHO2_01_FULL_39_10]|uniref:Uncharacterized protein n=1 Tax=Candidatus Gottesmanbacteria bacterium RIFCSPHIGHO2_01_FULL_39_10 TaxID=1798375 RepID=A0A1F5ZR09_9BACT|nr:MAG: hypothetical protein A2773_05620 [Candidatus Gottesmanbacteria bacterium RIFCSPHIGHO2_01_FULL_39_10]